MRYTTKLYLTFVTSIAVSCTENREVNILSEAITGSPVKMCSSNVDMGIQDLFGDITISNNVFDTQVLYGGYLTSKEWGKQDSLFKIGLGHNEFQRLVFGKGKNNSILLLNSPFEASKLTSLTTIKNTDSIDAIKNDAKWVKYELSCLPSFRCVAENFVSLSDTTILILGAPYSQIGHIMSIIDYKNQKVMPLEYWPNDGVDCDSLPKHSLYTDYCRLFGNDKGRFLYQFERERFAFIFTIEGAKVNNVKTLYSTFTEYKSDGSKLNYIQKRQSPKRLTCAVNNKYIYALLKDSDRKGNKLDEWKNPYVYGNTIEVFDWDGKKQKIIYLDKYGQRIFITEDNNMLYLLTDDFFEDGSRPEIWVYNLNEKL